MTISLPVFCHHRLSLVQRSPRLSLTAPTSNEMIGGTMEQTIYFLIDLESIVWNLSYLDHRHDRADARQTSLGRRRPPTWPNV